MEMTRLPLMFFLTPPLGSRPLGCSLAPALGLGLLQIRPRRAILLAEGSWLLACPLCHGPALSVSEHLHLQTSGRAPGPWLAMWRPHHTWPAERCPPRGPALAFDGEHTQGWPSPAHSPKRASSHTRPVARSPCFTSWCSVTFVHFSWDSRLQVSLEMTLH